MKKIIITQRIEKIGKHNELRDTIDIRLPNILEKMGYVPILLPNKIKNLNNYLNIVSPNGIILSGGGDPLKKDLRQLVENKLIRISIKKKIPLIGICRGAQVLNLFFGGKLTKVKNHVRKKHRIFGPIVKDKKVIVNSYHEYGFFEKTLGRNLNLLAYSSDKVIKSFCHNKYNLFGIMWHPERNMILKEFDKKIIKKIF